VYAIAYIILPNTSDLQLFVLFGRVTACILPTHDSLRKNASGPGYPLYLLWSLGPQKDAASTPHAMCCTEIGSLNSIPSAHSPAFRKPVLSSAEGLHFRKSASVRGLGHNFKDSDFHFTYPLVPGKIWEVNKLYFSSVLAFPIAIFKVKSALNTT
jgi:hypothetical protein